MTYTPRRLRSEWKRAPHWLITVPNHVTAEQAALIKEQWKAASRQGLVVVSENMKVQRLR